MPLTKQRNTHAIKVYSMYILGLNIQYTFTTKYQFWLIKIKLNIRDCIALLIWHSRWVLVWYIEGYDLGKSLVRTLINFIEERVIWINFSVISLFSHFVKLCITLASAIYWGEELHSSVLDCLPLFVLNLPPLFDVLSFFYRKRQAIAHKIQMFIDTEW